MELIPKNNSPSTIEVCRHITLLKSSFKIISKILTNRSAALLIDLIDEYQINFIKGKNIPEGIEVTQEVSHQCKRSRYNGFLLKLNFEKAYNMIGWECLMEV